MNYNEKCMHQLIQLQTQLDMIDDFCENTYAEKNLEYNDLIIIGKMVNHAKEMLSQAALFLSKTLDE